MKKLILVARYYSIEPLGIMYLAGVARDAGWQCQVVLVNEFDGGPDSLVGFMTNFCDTRPKLPPSLRAIGMDFGRDTMTQPNCYWTLTTPLFTIIGYQLDRAIDPLFSGVRHDALYVLSAVVLIALAIGAFMRLNHRPPLVGARRPEAPAPSGAADWERHP